MRFLEALPRYCQFASCVPLMMLVGITTADVVARYALSSSVPDAAEVSGMLLGILISLSFAFTTFQGMQVRFDLVIGRMQPRARLVADVITLALSTALFATVAWQTGKRVLYSMRSGEYIGAMEIPVWPSKAVFALGTVLTALVLAALFARALRQLLWRHAS